MKLISESKSSDKCEYIFKMASEYEQMMSSIVNSVLGIRCFAISVSSDFVDFNIAGMYFQLPLLQIPDWSDVFVRLDSCVDDGSLADNLMSVKVIASKHSSEGSLHLLHKDSEWSIPSESYAQAKTNSISFDDGTL